MKKTVKFELDLNNPPALTKKQRAEIEALQSLADEEIDYSDIPALSDQFWKNAVRNPFYNPVKTSTTVRLDAMLKELK